MVNEIKIKTDFTISVTAAITDSTNVATTLLCQCYYYTQFISPDFKTDVSLTICMQPHTTKDKLLLCT